MIFVTLAQEDQTVLINTEEDDIEEGERNETEDDLEYGDKNIQEVKQREKTLNQLLFRIKLLKTHIFNVLYHLFSV